MKIYDGEFFADSTVIVFKEYNKREYDCFVSSYMDLSKLKLPKMIKVHPIEELAEYILGQSIAGFNNQEFDDQITMFIITGQTSPEAIYAFSQGIISKTRENRFFKQYTAAQIKKYFSSIDLYKINHYDNPARSTGLKKLEFSYRSSSIQDLPFDHTVKLTRISELEDMITYCCKDCNETEVCYNKSVDKVQFRVDLKEQEGINCLNWSDVRIGESLNIRDYCNAMNIKEQELRAIKTDYDQPVNFSECIPDYIEFKTPELQTFLRDLKQITVKADSEFTRSLEFKGNKYTIAKGGIHSNEEERIIRSNDKYNIIDADVGSQYPSEMIKRRIYAPHLDPIIIENMEIGIKKRLYEYKIKAKTDNKYKQLSDLEKIKNNSLYGKLNSSYSPLYYPKGMFSVTLGCQMSILLLIEDLELAGFKVISANTDGLVTIVEKSREQEYKEICSAWETKIGNIELGKLEYTEYEFIIQNSVNDYLAKKTDGSIKRKGSWMIYEDYEQDNWHKNPSGLIIPLALQEYLINNIPIEDTVNNHKNIHDFVFGTAKRKTPKKGDFKWLMSEVNQGVITHKCSNERFIRYYATKDISNISKIYSDGSLTTLNSEVSIKECQILRYLDPKKLFKEELVYNIDYTYYINKAKNILNKCLENEMEFEN